VRRKLTYFAPFVPHASIPHAGGRFLHRYLSILSAHADVTLVAPASPLNRQALERERATLPFQVHPVPIRPRPRTPPGFLPRLVANSLAGVTPGWQVLRGFRRDGTVWDIVRGSDLVELQWAWYLPFVRDVRNAASVPVTAFEHDVLAESLARRARQGGLLDRTFGRVAAARAKSAEPALLNLCDTVFTFSDRDQAALRAAGVKPPIRVVDPPVELPPLCAARAGPPVVLFVGAMDRLENHQGAAWFATAVWPAIERAVPDARLVLAGAAPPRRMRELAGASIAVTGYVDDLDPIYREATAFVAPLLVGAGVKFKVLDAMSYALPVVATPVAAEGIGADGDGPGLAAVTDDPTAMAAAVVRLLSDRESAHRIGEAGRAWVEGRYDFERAVGRVLETYEGLIERGRP
jgi:glycosyltransferase involved in cell wall biosynthesis